MDQVFQALIDRSRSPLDLDRVKTIFGDKKRPHCDRRKKNPTRWGVAARCFARLAALDAAHAETYYRSAIAAEEAASGKGALSGSRTSQ